MLVFAIFVQFIDAFNTMNKELLEELENAYKKQDLDRTNELFNEIYELATKRKLYEETKLMVNKIIRGNIGGFRTPVSEITTALNGLIELYFASKQ